MNVKCLILDYPACNNPEVKDLIIKHAKKLFYKKGEKITVPGDNINCMKYIYSGKVRVLMIHPAGYEKILYILGEGWFLREAHFIGSITPKIAKNYSIAEEDVVIYSIDKNTYEKISDNKNFIEALVKCCAMKRTLLVDELYSVTFDTSEQRVKKLIVACIDYKHDLVDKKWYALKTQFTHRDMALLLGINRVTVSKIVNSLCRSKFIRIVNKRMQVNKNKLDQF